MGNVKSVKFNFLMNVILTASTLIFPLITFRYVSPILLPERVGTVNLAISFSQYFSMVAMLGVPTYGIRACAQVRDDKKKLSQTVQEILLLNLIVSVFTYIVYFLAIWWIPKLHGEIPLYLVMSATIIFNVIGVEWLYKGLEQYMYITVRSIVFKVIALVMMFLFVKSQGDYVIYGVISIFAAVGSNILNFINLRKVIDIRPMSGYDLRRHLKPVAIFFIMSVATTIYTNLDTVMLGFMQNDTALGYYTAAVKVKGILVSLVTALSAVLLPRVSYYIEHEMKEEFERVGKKAISFVVLVATPVVVYFILYAKETIIFLSTDIFLPATVPMQIIMPTVLLIGITNVLGIQILVPLGREMQVCTSVIIGAIVDFVINLICIPSLSSSGAAIGTLVAEAVVLLIQIWFLRTQIKLLTSEIHGMKVLISVIVAGFVCIWIQRLGLGCFLTLVSSFVVFCVVYAIVLLALREPLAKEMIGMVHGKIRRK